MLKLVESIVHFCADIDAAAQWYAELLDARVEHETRQYAFVRAANGVVLGFHPADAKCPGGVGGTTVYWEVDDLAAALRHLEDRGAKLHRGPAQTALGAKVAMLIDPFGCTIGLNQSSSRSRSALGGRDASPREGDRDD